MRKSLAQSNQTLVGYHIKHTKENSTGAVESGDFLLAILAANCMPHYVYDLNRFSIGFIIRIGNFFHVSESV
ncbi:MAG: hypothetical protein ACHQ1H_14225 [Nitrososphaerales archaeon]